MMPVAQDWGNRASMQEQVPLTVIHNGRSGTASPAGYTRLQRGDMGVERIFASSVRIGTSYPWLHAMPQALRRELRYREHKACLYPG